MWKVVALFILISVLEKINGFLCFIDTYGTLPTKDGEVLDTTKFKFFNCSMNTKIEKVNFKKIDLVNELFKCLIK